MSRYLDPPYNTCDHDHDTKEEIRRLPMGSEPGHGNILCCKKHYQEEIAFRKGRNKEVWTPFDLPKWEDLDIYSEAIK